MHFIFGDWCLSLESYCLIFLLCSLQLETTFSILRNHSEIKTPHTFRNPYHVVCVCVHIYIGLHVFLVKQTACCSNYLPTIVTLSYIYQTPQHSWNKHLMHFRTMKLMLESIPNSSPVGQILWCVWSVLNDLV